jgi:hypothetical protein
MKISKAKLRQIIKEEKAKLREIDAGWDPSGEEITSGYYNAINQLVWDEWSAAGVDPEEKPEEVEYVKTALQNLLADLERGQF